MTYLSNLDKVVRNTFLLGLCILCIGLSLSKFLMSLGQFVIALAWLSEVISKKNLAQKFNDFRSNKAALLTSIIFLIHLVGMAYTKDINYGVKDLRVKLPILILPFLLSSLTLYKSEVQNILSIFIASTFIGSAWSALIYFQIVNIEFYDVRELSRFISHIRFSLLIVVTISILSLRLLRTPQNKLKAFYTLLIIWFLGVLRMLESATGFSILVCLFVAFLLYYIFKSRALKAKLSALFLMILAPLLLFLYVNSIYRSLHFPEKKIHCNSVTSSGRKYISVPSISQKENGHLVWENLCPEEVEKVWNLRSTIAFNDRDKSGSELRGTLYRYLTSKGVCKDSAAVASLSDLEIKHIQNGISNYRFTQKGNVTARLYELLWEMDEYQTGSDISFHSAARRLEFVRTGLHILKKHWLIGVGTGDVKQAFYEMYITLKSALVEEARLRAHNQFITIGIALGSIGLIIFMACLLLCFKKALRERKILYTVFFITFLLSMLTEDTLETQAGISFFVFFQCLLLIIKTNKHSDKRINQPS